MRAYKQATQMSFNFLLIDKKTNKPKLKYREGPDGVFLLGFFMIPVAMIANTMANRFIRKDEKLVRSVDRIR